jgi:hypothetical protein
MPDSAQPTTRGMTLSDISISPRTTRSGPPARHLLRLRRRSSCPANSVDPPRPARTERFSTPNAAAVSVESLVSWAGNDVVPTPCPLPLIVSGAGTDALAAFSQSARELPQIMRHYLR